MRESISVVLSSLVCVPLLWQPQETDEFPGNLDWMLDIRNFTFGGTGFCCITLKSIGPYCSMKLSDLGRVSFETCFI